MPQLHFTDQLQRCIAINYPPKRIISLVPSQTELLFDLGLDAKIIAVTKFCTKPSAKVKSKTKIGGTKTLDIDLIRTLSPDLIIGNKEENERAQLEILMEDFPVFVSDINNIKSALEMITTIGKMVNKGEQANNIATQIEVGFDKITPCRHPIKIAYLIWQKPYMAAGASTFINNMLQLCGWQNVVTTNRYPEVGTNVLKDADVIMLSSEPFPFRQKHIDAISLLCPQAKVVLVDGEMFSWYGSRLLQTPDYLNKIILDINNLLIYK